MTDLVEEAVHGSSEESSLSILPMGGLGEIGMNMMVLACRGNALIIDAGLMFPDASMPGVDLVIPDLEALTALQWNILGIILTHGHEDHIGALPYVLQQIPVPVYATGLTMGFVENKLAEFDLLRKTERHLIGPGEVIRLEPFEVTFFAMCHSVPDGVGLAVRSPAGLVIHSGDFKIDPAPIDGRCCDLDVLSRLGREDVLALFSDSTNVEIEGRSGSESSIRPGLSEIFANAPGRILIATFSSNIHRIQQILELSVEFDRKVVLVGRSMESNVRIASERGHLTIPPGVTVDIKDAEEIPDEKLTVLSTGSQGEPMSALTLMATDRHKYFSIKEGDVLVLSSRFIPGNEKAINVLVNEFCRRGARVEYEKVSKVHVSGHAAKEELRDLIRAVRPRHFIPVHGEYRHLWRHAMLAREEGIPEERVILLSNGDIAKLGAEGVSVTRRLELKKVFVDGKGVGDVGNDVLRDRRILSEVGLVTVVLIVSRETGELVLGPKLVSRGVTFHETEEELIEVTRQAVLERIDELRPRASEDWENIREEVRLTVRRNINRRLGRKPLVETIILES
jgi:ribonuclease J